MATKDTAHAGAIDVHAHMLVPEVFRLTKSYGLTSRPIENEAVSEELKRTNAERQDRVAQTMYDTADRVALMDGMGVGVQVLTCSLVHQCTYWMAPEDSLRHERLANDTMAAKIRANPTRFRGFGGVPLQAPKLAVQELERAVGELGLTGIQISTNAGGREVGHPDLHPFWAKAEELGAIIYIHPAGSHDERLKPYFQWNSIGQSYEESMAISSLMYEGILDKFPKLHVCISHGGGYMPFNFGRINRNWLEKPSTRVHMKQPPADFLKMLWYDSCVYEKDLLQRLVDVVGADRIVLGSDYPVGDRKPVEFIRACELGAETEEKILRGNAERFLLL
jgi:aminocarboxymuconate-semialdehyde decarboxylase